MTSINRLAEIYPEDAIQVHAGDCDVIEFDNIHSIPDLLDQRIARSRDALAYWQYCESEGEWQNYSWGDIGEQVRRWRQAISAERLERGDRIAIRLRNSVEWVVADQAALAEGMVVVPVYSEDRVDNITYILEQTGVKLLFVDHYDQWIELASEREKLQALQRVIVLGEHQDESENNNEPGVVCISQWLGHSEFRSATRNPARGHSNNGLATIVFTSGTTGRPKGVMLSHRNLLANAYAGLQSIAIFPSDRFVSFLPLSHMFERTAGYYLPIMSAAQVYFSRSTDKLMDDIQFAKPTALVTVPLIFEKALGAIHSRMESASWLEKMLFRLAVSAGWHKFQFQQGRAGFRIIQLAYPLLDRMVAEKVRRKFGSELRLAVCGGARLNPEISKTFIGLGVTLLQGYGLTETSPVLTVNVLANNRPETIGLPLRGAELRLGENDELQVRSPFNMLGYWDNEDASREIQDSRGWLHTGDIATIDSDGFVSISGRLKELIVLGNGEKVPPADMEAAIMSDPLFEQVLVLGEGRAFLTAVVVVNRETWQKIPAREGQDQPGPEYRFTRKDMKIVLERIRLTLAGFPGYAFIRYACPVFTPWTVANGLITPTFKLKRSKLLQFYEEDIEQMYSGKSPSQD